MEVYATLAVVSFMGVLYVGGAILVSRLLAPRTSAGGRRDQPIECGAEPVGDARIRFKSGYYLFALVFMVFDVEALFLFPCVKHLAASRGDGPVPWMILVEVGIFTLVLVLGLVFAWRRKVLQWQ